jgi:hypothetical protein
MISAVDDSVGDDDRVREGEYGGVAATGNSSCDKGMRWKK